MVASKDHVRKGVEWRFAQAGPRKKAQLQKLEKDDWVVSYSSKLKSDDTKPFRKFIAMGQLTDDEPFQVTVSVNFKPWLRKIGFNPSTN